MNRREASDGMKQAQQDFLNLARLPGTIDAQQAGYLLGIAPAHVSILVSKGFLHPLGRSLAPNAPRRFSSVAICKLASDPHEMDKMHQILSSYWRVRNGTGPGANKPSKKNNLNGVASVASS